ncbi:hypothetical protein IJ750_02360 [bacterium]|nr:hypothetical protein [bacterium]
MKKPLLLITSILVCALSVNIACARTTTSPALTSAIKMYKSGNYVQTYSVLSDITKKDPSNAVAYYYLAMTCVQVGKKSEAIANYDKVLNLSPSGQLGRYALKGKTCIETPDKCHEPLANESEMDKFIHTKYGSGFSKEVRSDYEKQKIQNLMREMNRNNEITPNKFKDYKDFSSEVPTNDEIVTALRTLQNAGFGNMIIGNNYNSDLSLLTGNQNNTNNFDMLNLLLNNNNKNDSSAMSPQLIQALLTSQMSAGF